MSRSASGYEFRDHQNKLIGSLAAKMNFVGLLAVTLGGIRSADQAHRLLGSARWNRVSRGVP
jgi:hypothetical protein